MISVKTVVVGGTPSSGKTRVVLWLHSQAVRLGRSGIAKLDCLVSGDEERYRSRGIPAMTLLSGRYCPDHELMEKMTVIQQWSVDERLDTVVIETAGLCGRCAPYLVDALAICVVDCTSGIHAPWKLGPVLTDADVCLMTKGDLVSQAEREVFALNVRSRNPAALLMGFNGLTGEGAASLAGWVDDHLENLSEADETHPMRTPLPQLYCSYCLGRAEVGITCL